MTENCCETGAVEGTGDATTAIAPRSIGRPSESRVQGLAIAGGILGAVGAASCCVIPFALFGAGVSGAWIGNLTALEPYQPLFAAGAFASIGYGAYRVYAKRKADCAPGTYCATPQSDLLARLGLIAATVLVIGALGFPYLIRAVVA